jgi:hypothetical protein
MVMMIDLVAFLMSLVSMPLQAVAVVVTRHVLWAVSLHLWGQLHLFTLRVQSRVLGITF